jgi:CHAD domain-containing protein
VHELDSARYLTLLDRFEGMLARLEPAERPPSLDALVKRQLAKLRRSVDALDADPTDADLHSQRKRGKRLRYTAELARRATFVKRAKAFQDVLGEHQDAVVAQEKLRELAASATPEQALAAGRLIERARERQAHARAAWPKAWRRLARTD